MDNRLKEWGAGDMVRLAELLCDPFTLTSEAEKSWVAEVRSKEERAKALEEVAAN